MESTSTHFSQSSQYLVSIPVLKKDIQERLRTLARCQNKEEYNLGVPFKQEKLGKMGKSILDQLQPQILRSDDLNLIELFKRAVRVHNTFYPKHSTNPVTSWAKHHPKLMFKTPKTNLILDVKEKEVIVTTTLEVCRCSTQNFLVLDGVNHKVHHVYINGKELPKEQYHVTPHELIIKSVPQSQNFTIQIKSSINPYNNLSMEGLYQSGQWLTTQCESKGARRIFYTIDRPDNLSKFTVTIIADPKKYPTCISNGNLISEKSLENGRKSVTWKDPFPKPSYLFATVLGEFDIVEGTYQIDENRQVKLQVFTEKGKAERGKYALWALQQSMRFDQEFFDRVYDLEHLKMVAIPDFNMGAMENKGLLIFNEDCLLVDKNSGTDQDFLWVADVIMHEYAHNWSGNRVTVKNWFELPLKEAFTDFRTMLFSEHFFSAEVSRWQQIQSLREGQFPEDASPLAHPIQVQSYVSSDDIYDATTYVKGREVFRMLYTILGEKFRQAQNAYFEKYDGQAVTFKELLSCLTESSQVDLTIFERWFHQPGTPWVSFNLDYDPKAQTAKIRVKQTCPHPKTGEEQKPFHIPLFLELLGKNGQVIASKRKYDFKDREAVYTFSNISEKPIPLFLHGLSAPVKWEYPFTDDELATISLCSDDAFWRFEAGHIYVKRQLVKLLQNPKEGIPDNVTKFYQDVLSSQTLSPLAKARLLKLPSLRTLAEAWGSYNYPEIEQVCEQFQKHLAIKLEQTLLKLLEDYPTPKNYNPFSEDFINGVKIRALRNHILSYLMLLNEEKYVSMVLKQYNEADNFNDKKAALDILINTKRSEKETVINDFHNQWKNDKAVFTQWISALSGSAYCTIDTLEKVRKAEGFQRTNPNHLRSLLRGFTRNLSCYHDPNGKCYEYIADRIIEIAQFNVHIASGIAENAFIDYKKLTSPYKEKMEEQLQRLQKTSDLPNNIKDLVNRYLN